LNLYNSGATTGVVDSVHSTFAGTHSFTKITPPPYFPPPM
jgi:hypothetical protein